jgi:hypothetical protein
MTRDDQTLPMIDSVVSDLWFSLFETTFDALLTWMRRIGFQHVYAGRISA